MMRIECGVTTEIGNVRRRNEDNYLVGHEMLVEGASGNSIGGLLSIPSIVAVCDGMGGSGYGQEASLTAVKSLYEYSQRLHRADASEAKNSLEALIQKVNLEVVALKRKGLDVGTTLALAYLAKERIYLANVGDSRIYQYKDGRIKKLSVDHNRGQAYHDLTGGAGDCAKIKGANELTQFLGIDPREFIIEPHVESIEYSDMTLLLCSDGLTSVLSEEEIAKILANTQKKSMKLLSERLVEQALKHESKDNITVMVIKIELETRKGSISMNNFDPHTLEPFWESWYIDRLIGEGSFGYVYKIYKEEFGQRYYSALKIISLPKTEAEAKEILYETTNQDTATQYFRDIAEVIYKEIQIMEELKGKTNIVSFEDHKIVSKEDGIGYYILIRMELLTCLNDYLMKNSMTTKMLHRLAMDLCKALQLCQKRNIIHRDIKPANIFVSSDGDFKLGDFGIARQLEGVESGLSIKGTYSYMAPEVYMGNPYDERADIYSLGMVLYYYLNHKHSPFTNPDSTVQRYSEKQEALKRRFSGEEFPNPVSGSKELIEIVKKACAFKPEDRYANAGELLEALESIKEIPDEVLVEVGQSSKSNEITERSSSSVNAVRPSVFEEDEVTVSEPKKADKKLELVKEEEEITGEKEIDTGIPPVQSDHTWLDQEQNQNEDDLNQIPVEEEQDQIVNDEDEATVLLTSSQAIEVPKEEEPTNSGKSKGKNKLVVGIVAAVALVVLSGGIIWGIKQSKEKDEPTVAVVTVTQKPDEITQEVTPTVEATPEPTNEVTPTVEATAEPTNEITPTVEATPEKVKEYEVELNAKGLEDYSEIKNLEKVTSLTLKENKLTSVKALSKSIYLTYLDLETNKIKKLDGIENLIELEFLNLNRNKVSDISGIEGLTKMNTLLLSDNKLTDISPLAKLTQLRELRLNQNEELQDISALKSLEYLQVLDLSGTQVDNISSLYELKNLSILNLQNTSVKKKQIDILKEKLPDCTIIQ